MTARLHRTNPPPDLGAVLADLSVRFAGSAAQHDREASFPFERFDALHAAGLLDLTAPARFGRAGVLNGERFPCPKL